MLTNERKRFEDALRLTAQTADNDDPRKLTPGLRALADTATQLAATLDTQDE